MKQNQHEEKISFDFCVLISKYMTLIHLFQKIYKMASAKIDI